MNDFIKKLENPKRVEELDPAKTLEKIGILDSHTLCDIGAGSGLFTIPAAKMTKNYVYAVEINDEMLDVIKCKAKQEGLENIKLIKSDGDSFPVPNDSIDIVLLVTVLHEIENKNTFLKNIKSIMKKGGKLAIIEFIKKETPFGPPISHRISYEEVNAVMQNSGFALTKSFDLGENYYCSVFERN